MKINNKELRRIIREAIQSESGYKKGSILNEQGYGTVRGGEVPGPFEYKLATAIANSFESHEMQMGAHSRVGPTWPAEVDKASADLEEALNSAELEVWLESGSPISAPTCFRICTAYFLSQPL